MAVMAPDSGRGSRGCLTYSVLCMVTGRHSLIIDGHVGEGQG